ncbi:hypothetical protein LP421_08910 [Rhizobium sp. RCAM05350]|nr:hypothetical protein LP421_08910 [Rhizobium sp. RCAM05350]
MVALRTGANFGGLHKQKGDHHHSLLPQPCGSHISRLNGESNDNENPDSGCRNRPFNPDACRLRQRRRFLRRRRLQFAPRRLLQRYNRNERWRDRTDYSGDREYRHSDHDNDEGRTDWREREGRGGDDRRCRNDPRCEVPEYNPERPGYYRRG